MKPTKPMKPIWTYPLTWMAVVALAVVLAVASPRPIGVMGRLPSVVGQKLEDKPQALPGGEERILALVSFHRDQRKDVDSWITGLRLHHDPSITWVRMPVVNDPGDPTLRAAAEGRLLARYPNAQDRKNLLPVITDRQAFVQAAGLRDTGSAYALVLNRSGDVLARVAGQFDEGKAETLMDILAMREL